MEPEGLGMITGDVNTSLSLIYTIFGCAELGWSTAVTLAILSLLFEIFKIQVFTRHAGCWSVAGQL